MLTHALYDKSLSRSIVYLASVCDLAQRASVSMRKCADWVNLKFVYYNTVPGWNDYVKDLHEESRDAACWVCSVRGITATIVDCCPTPSVHTVYEATDADLGNTLPCFNYYLWKVSQGGFLPDSSIHGLFQFAYVLSIGQ